ncbi:hypothetical protein BDN70DRAFT_927827 [Pholiota conissans]|uniref:Uncharacterized protein n=1 Tax=Pholiota conissans TaxID=109636 RepID=A0A9P5ZCQ6_9AGAR|nr:hypothetical protein BDN70DRAFT_927827 [Pholiota conissans]
MALAPSPLLRFLHALHRWLLRTYKLQFVGQVLSGVLRRLVLLGRLLRSKLRLSTKGNDKLPKGELATGKDDGKNATTDQVSYTVIRHGDTISLDKASFSMYPFSSGGIRSTSRASRRQGSSRSRSESRSSHHPESNYSHSNIGSVFELPLHPVRTPSGRNRRRQFSTSMPDIHSPITGRPRGDWLHSQPRSSLPELEINLASLVRSASAGYQNDYMIRYQYPPRSDQPDSNLPYSPLSSPRSAIEMEPISPISPFAEVNSPASINQTGLRAPASSGHSQPVSQPLNTNRSGEETHEIRPVLPEDTRRYARRTRKRKIFYNLQIEEVTTVFNHPAAPGGWVRLAHPEGACYYHHPEKRVYTDSYINDPEIRNRVMDDITRLERLQRQFSESILQDATLMIDVNRADKGNFETSYYYVDHSQKTVFLLHPLEAWDINCAQDVQGITSRRHLGYEMQAQYWYFVSLYPDSTTLTAAMVCELRDILLYYIGEIMTSPDSTSPYNLDDLIRILGITGEMEKNALIGYPGTMAVFARHMYIFGHTRFLNCHGESFARIERGFSIFGDPLDKRTWLIKLLSFILFSAPDVHLRALQQMYVDEMLSKSMWLERIKVMNAEWKEYVFFATVMLTSSVGLLTIQSVDVTESPFRSATQILAYLSIIANIGTLILGLVLMSQDPQRHREMGDDTASCSHLYWVLIPVAKAGFSKNLFVNDVMLNYALRI